MDTSLVAYLVLGAMFFVCVHGNGFIVVNRWRAGSHKNAASAPGEVSSVLCNVHVILSNG